MSRYFLGIIGVVYIILATICAIMPERASKTVGYTLQAGAGQSEFLTVYGGLELALGIIFLWPLYHAEEMAFPLLVCLVVHGCLALSRSVAFMLFSDFPTTTYVVAVVEWMIFLGAGVLYWRK